MLEIFVDSLIDCAKLLPFLFATYVLMEWLEKKTEKVQRGVFKSAGAFGPAAGGILGVVPQCGFSLVAANLYSGGLITVGVLVAVFMSTSDEMLPICISSAVPAATIAKILTVKAVLAILTGYGVDAINKALKPAKPPVYEGKLRHDHHHGDRHFHQKDDGEKHIYDICEQEHCKCNDGILLSSVKHTAKIALFIFVFTFVLELVLDKVGYDTIAAAFGANAALATVLSAVVGIIPNCASSVVITELYIENIITAGTMMAGLFMNAGVGLLVLFRMNKHRMKENAKVLGAIYVASVAWGLIIDAVGLTF